MKKTILCCAILSTILPISAAYAAPVFDANVELNTDSINKSVGDNTYDQNGRVELNVYGKHTKGEYYVAGRGTVLITTDGTADVDDAYAQLGNNKWDFKLGRFEATNLFPLGKDTLIVHTGDVSVYEANNARGRVGDDGGQIAFHYYPTDKLRFELGTVVGDDDKDGNNTKAASGIRPVVSYDTSFATFTAGYERTKYELTAGGDVDKDGLGVTVLFDLAGAVVNVSASHEKDKNTEQKVNSYGANMTYGNFGLGLIASSEDNKTGVDPSVVTTYIAYSVPIFDIESALITFAGSYSKASDVADGTNDRTIAGRVRINYYF